MSPDQLDEYEVQFRRHPTSPNVIPMALELVAELRARGLAQPVLVAEIPAPAVTAPEAQPADAEPAASPEVIAEVDAARKDLPTEEVSP
jgi:hypothetical protein